MSFDSLRRTAGRLGAALVLLALGTAAAAAQTGTLSGTVVDGDLRESVIGANVRIDGTALGAATDLDGDYRIPAIPAGTYTVRFSYVGFETQAVSGVVIQPGQTTELNIVLTTGSLGEAVVEAAAIIE